MKRTAEQAEHIKQPHQFTNTNIACSKTHTGIIISIGEHRPSFVWIAILNESYLTLYWCVHTAKYFVCDSETVRIICIIKHSFFRLIEWKKWSQFIWRLLLMMIMMMMIPFISIEFKEKKNSKHQKKRER